MVALFCLLEDFENALPRLIVYCSNTEDDGEINFISYQSLTSFFMCPRKVMVVKLI